MCANAIIEVSLEKKKGFFKHNKNYHGCTVHVDNIKYFICSNNAHTNYSRIVELLLLLL